MTIALDAPAGRRTRLDLSWPILIGFAAVLCALIVLPMSWLVYYSFTDKAGSFTLDNFVKLATDPTFVDPLVTTVIIATSSAVVCCLVAAPMGWLVARTDLPLRRTIRALVTASFVTPPFLGAIAWEILAAPNSGLLNQLYRAVTGAPPDEHLFDIYTLAGLIFVISCYTFPYVFVLVANALDRIPGDLEDAVSRERVQIHANHMPATLDRNFCPLLPRQFQCRQHLERHRRCSVAAVQPIGDQLLQALRQGLHGIRFIQGPAEQCFPHRVGRLRVNHPHDIAQ